MSPTIVEGMLWQTGENAKALDIIIGAAGGIRIFSAVFQLLINIIDRKKKADKAILFPRFHDDLLNSEIENPYAPRFIKELRESYGHKLRGACFFSSSIHMSLVFRTIVLNFFRYDKTSVVETIVISDSELQGTCI
jgi:gamma-glutamyltranspeptidase